ncbi:hypothetical protein [Streptomyces sp. bgisy100]|uniref:hypothetical protein n=1 Tax=Streptomyces sp. bgisy100 TaxID=3413783 RepID=UPI003D741A43
MSEQPSPPAPAEYHVETSDSLFGGVYGLVLASALLSALQAEGASYTPVYDALWVLVTAISSALAHGYARHMSTYRPGTAGHRWLMLLRTLLREWPLVTAALPTVLLLCVAELAHWSEEPATAAGLGVNTVLLFGLGMFAALRMGYKQGGAILIGLADAAVGLLIAIANAIIK